MEASLSPLVALLLLVVLALPASLGAPFFPDEAPGSQRGVDAYDAEAKGRTHGLIRLKKRKKQQLLCAALQGVGVGGGGGGGQAHGRTFDLLALGLGLGQQQQQAPSSSGLCPQGGGGGGGGFPPVSPGGGGGFPPVGPGGGGGGGPATFPPVSSGGGRPPLGGLPGGLLGEGQEILSSVVGLVGAVSQAGGGAVSGLLGGRPQRYLRPLYRALRPYYSFF